MAKIRGDAWKAYSYLRKEGAWVLFGRLYLLGISLVSSVILSRILTESEYGIYKYVISVLALSAIFALPESAHLIVRFIPQGYANVYAQLLKQRTRYSILGCLALALYAAYEFNQSPALGYTLVGIAILYPLYFAFQLYEPLLQATIKFKTLNRIYVTKATLQLGAVLLAYWVTQSIYVAVLAMVAAISAFNFITERRVAIEFRESSPAKAPASSGEIEKQSLILSILSIMPIAITQIDRILVARVIDYRALAIFSIGLTIGTAVNSFLKPFISTINAKLVHRNLEPVHYILVFVIGTAVGWLISLVMPEAIRSIYGQRYLQSAQYAGIILLSMGLYLTQTLYYNNSLFNKYRSLGVIYVNNIVVPLLVLAYLLVVYLTYSTATRYMLQLALLYPIRLSLSIAVLLLANFRRRRGFPI